MATDMDFGRFETIEADHEVWQVVKHGTHGNPLEVRPAAASAWLSGSVLEARLNTALAVFELRLQVWLAWPSWIRRWVPAPRPFWRGVAER